MEIKHTIEILTKDIQDIEKLVRNFNNYPSPPKIEIDLAMSKLRNVYDLLSMIASDITVDLSSREDIEREIAEDNERENEKAAGSDIEAAKKHPKSETSFQPDAGESKPTPENNLQNSDESPLKETKQPNQQIPPVGKAKDAKKSDPPKNKEILKPSKTEEEKQKAAILAEKFKADKSINEKIASKSDEDKEAFGGEPIDSIRRNIGINDRFMIIRELLDGENDAYIEFIDELDHSEGYNEAIKKIEDKFPDNSGHEGIKILINLAKRKFLSKGNG